MRNWAERRDAPTLVGVTPLFPVVNAPVDDRF